MLRASFFIPTIKIEIIILEFILTFYLSLVLCINAVVAVAAAACHSRHCAGDVVVYDDGRANCGLIR